MLDDTINDNVVRGHTIYICPGITYILLTDLNRKPAN
jgi:hypothetical protein